MSKFTHSTTNDWNLEKTIVQISKSESVMGIMQIGSLCRKQVSSQSDYDLVIIFDEAAKSWYVGVSFIENRLTDLIFVRSSEIERVLALDTPVAQNDELAPIIRWVRDGEILYARSKSLQHTQEKTRTQALIEPIDDEAAYSAWFRINYNLAQLRRMLTSNDSVYKQAVNIRIAVYGHSDIWFGYFTIRRIEFLGDKAAIRYLCEHDPEFLSSYQQFINGKSSVDEKFAAYERVASMATAPMGTLWPEISTVMNLENTLEIWQRLLGSDQSGKNAH
jgi:predicted nucleotidyltransferase